MTMILRWIMPRARRTMLLAGLVLASLSGLATAQPLTTPLQPDDIDHDATAVWGQGELRTDVEFHPTCFIWTQKTRPGHAGVRFGAQWPEPGPRHLRIGFTRDVPVGALLVRADPDVRLSLLRPDAPYPGEPDNEAHWMPAERKRMIAGTCSRHAAHCAAMPRLNTMTNCARLSVQRAEVRFPGRKAKGRLILLGTTFTGHDKKLGKLRCAAW